MKKQETYRVTFGDTEEVLNEEGLQHFVSTAVINNKDINDFSVQRIDAMKSSESNHTVEELLNDCGARAIRIAALTCAPGPIRDAIHIAVNLKKVIELLGYEQES